MPGDADGDYWLDLGEVCIVADVSINGQEKPGIVTNKINVIPIHQNINPPKTQQPPKT